MDFPSAIRELAAAIDEREWVEQTYITWRKTPAFAESSEGDRFGFQDLTVQVTDDPTERVQAVRQMLADPPVEMDAEVVAVEYYAHDEPTDVILLTRSQTDGLQLPDGSA